MELHKNKDLFISIIMDIAHAQTLDPAIVEKDYYVTLFLSVLKNKLPNLIFKGGTSLSKCYKVIKRFSEDIDVTVDFNDSLTQGQYKEIKQAVVDTAEMLELEITNLDQARSRRDFNKYEIAYPAEFALAGIKPFLLLETYVAVRSFPTELKNVSSIIGDYLMEQGKTKAMILLGFNEFTIRTQALDRTLIDKVFAICDYYITGKEADHSRHLYDVYKILPLVKIDDSFKVLVKEVRELRKISKYCHSAQDGVDINTKLKEVIDQQVYRKDYEQTFYSLLYEDVKYEQTVGALQKIIELNAF